MRSLKIFWVLLVSLSLIAFMVSSSPLMASTSPSHSTHFDSVKGPGLPLNGSGCYKCHADGILQCDEDGPVFWDNKSLQETLVCDTCHSPNGAFDGVGDLDPGNPDSVAFGAKYNWDVGVYQSNGEALKAGKEKWCVTCHDGGTSVCDGVDAPNVGLYYTSGHGRPGPDVECLVCHDVTFTHIDGEARTYWFNDEDVYPADFIVDMYDAANSGVAYAAGYRLRYVDGEVPMMIPAALGYTFKSDDDARVESASFRRCFDSGCHDSRKIFRSNYSDTGIHTNFWDGGSNIHDFHLIRTVSWDSDWDIDTPQIYSDGSDSLMTCPSCHNVHGAVGTHGSTNEPMVRDGSLVGRTGFGFSYVVDDTAAGGYPWVTSEGATQSTSIGAIFRNGTGEMCGGCHGTGTYATPSDSSYYAASTTTLYNGPHAGPTSLDTLTVDGTPWTEGQLVGKYLHNITDDTYDTIIANTENTASGDGLCCGLGEDEEWHYGDMAEIYEYTHIYYMQWFRPWQDCSSSVDMIWTYHSDPLEEKDYTSLSAWEEDTDIDITIANDVMIISHSGLTNSTIASGDTVTGQNSGATGVVVGVVTDTQICIDVTSGDFQNEEQIYKTLDNYVFSTSPPDHVGVMYLDCYDGPHFDRVALAGATTDVVHYRCIRSASDCSDPFAGTRDTGAYFEWNQDNHVFKLNENFARVEHIGAKLTYTSDTNTKVVFNILGDYAKVIGCVAYDSVNYGTKSVIGFSLVGDRTLGVNCIAHDIEGDGFNLAAAYWLDFCLAYNCTAVDNEGYGFSNNFSNYNMVSNSVGSNNTAGDFKSNFTSYYSDYNMSSDDTAPGPNNKTDKDFTDMWVSEALGSEDYHLSEIGVADSDFQGGAYPAPAGLNPPDYFLTDDIDGEPRSIWYRGADESGPRGQEYQNISTISGSIGIDGVTITGLPCDPVVTSGGGLYSAIVSNGWSGTVTPTKVGYTFDPASRMYSDVTTDQANQDYTPIGTFYTISGRVGNLDGITMGGVPEFQLKTSGGGLYSSTVGHGWSGTVGPIDYSNTYRFDPASRVYPDVTSDRLNQDYTPILVHTISGKVRDPELGWAGIEGVTMSGLPGNPVTNSQGSYSDKVDDGWSGTVTPTKVGYTFDTTSLEYVNITETLWNQNYAGTVNTYTISGSVGIDGVTMSGLPGDPVSSSGGLYSATVDYDWSGTVTPAKVGYTFEPPSCVYSNVTSDQENEDYTYIMDSTIIIHESFEGAGYEEAFAENIGTSCILDENSSIPGTPPVDFGSQCLKSVSNATGYKARADLVYGSEQIKTFTTLYVYVTSESLANSEFKNIGAWMDGSGNTAAVLRLYRGGAGNLKIRLRFYNNGSYSPYNSAAISLNTWYKVQFKYDDTSNTWEYKVNGTTRGSGSLTGDHRTGVKQWRLGFWQSSQAETGTIYIDQLTVSTESFD